MNFKYELTITTDADVIVKQYKTLQQIADEYDIPIHLIRKIVLLTEGRQENHKAHYRNRDIFDKMKIKELKRNLNI